MRIKRRRHRERTVNPLALKLYAAGLILLLMILYLYRVTWIEYNKEMERYMQEGLQLEKYGRWAEAFPGAVPERGADFKVDRETLQNREAARR